MSHLLGQDELTLLYTRTETHYFISSETRINYEVRSLGIETNAFMTEKWIKYIVLI